MFVTRNQIMNALFTQLKTMKGFNGFSRRFSMWDKLSGASLPYLMLCKPKESYPQRVASQLPAKRTFYAEIIIYFADGKNQAAVPDEVLNDILDKVDEVLKPRDPREAQTLGGLVESCLIDGDVTCVPGDLDGVGIIHIPLKIIVP